MPAKDSEKRKEIARTGALAQHKKHGCLIPLEARQRGGRTAGKLYGGRKQQNHGFAESLFDKKAESQGFRILKHGFPDRLIIKDGKAKFVEVKYPKEALSPAQVEMHSMLRSLGLEVEIWRPSIDELPQRLQDHIRKGKGVHRIQFPIRREA